MEGISKRQVPPGVKGGQLWMTAAREEKFRRIFRIANDVYSSISCPA